MVPADYRVQPIRPADDVGGLSLLDNVSQADIVHQPFPHLVVRNALDRELADRLLTHIPPFATPADGQAFGSNVRVTYASRVWRQDPSLSQIWKRFLNEHVSQTFLNRLISVFGPALRRLHPRFEERCGPLERLHAGLQPVDQLDRGVALDAQICANTPVLDEVSPAGRPRIYSPHKLFVGLYFLRHFADTSTGGDLELYGPRAGSSLRRLGRVASPQHFDLCRTVRYEHNVLVLFLNSIDAVHLVTPRSRTRYSRLLVSLAGEVKDPLWRFQKSRYGQTQQRLLWYARTRERAQSSGDMPRVAEDAQSTA